MTQEIPKIKTIRGELNLPGDKSISHRSVIFSSLAGGKSKITNLLQSADITSSINCFRNLGCSIEKQNDEYLVTGKGYGRLIAPNLKLDAGNSGTTARLISGVLAAQKFSSLLIGDESLSQRPMKRISEPLSLMGSDIKLSKKATLPALFTPAQNLKSISYELPVASAQVKSAILLAGIHLGEETTVIEKIETRDHTERMLGCKIIRENNQKIIKVSKANYPTARDYVVPSDISTAAFFIVLTLLNNNSELLLKNISLNPTRTGIIRILQEMGGDIKIENHKNIAGENLGDLIVRFSELKNIVINRELIPNIIDEIPILSVAGLFAEGVFEIRGAGELRFKESDRIKSLCHNYQTLGLGVTEFDDGFSLSGNIKNSSPVFESYGDHRIAMAFAVLSALHFEKAKIKDFECVAISNPDFLAQLKSISV